MNQNKSKEKDNNLPYTSVVNLSDKMVTPLKKTDTGSKIKSKEKKLKSVEEGK